MMMIYSITVFKQEREKLKKEFINLRQADIVANIYSPSQPPPPQFRPSVHAKFSHHWTRNRKLTFCQHVILSHYFHTHLFGPPPSQISGSRPSRFAKYYNYYRSVRILEILRVAIRWIVSCSIEMSLLVFTL